jgi:CHAT domain-containing protein
VVLSACETANGDFSRPFSVIAKSLVERGIPAVVANQFPLPDKSAAVFSEGLYLELLQSGDIDRAVNAGRMQLLLQLEETKSHASLEWGIPILYRRFRNSQIYTP